MSSTTSVRIPWRAWYGDEWVELRFPESWQVQDYWPRNGEDLSAEAIEAAFDQPIGTPPLETLARRKRWVSIAVDDLSRPCPAGRLFPPLMRRLEKAGVDLDRVRVVMGIGVHRAMTKEDIVKKIGPVAAARLDVHNNAAYGHVAQMGVSKRGTPVHISRFFADADLKIGVGSIVPHSCPGLGGGAKVVIPGVAGIETIAAIHQPGRLAMGINNVDNEFRADLEQMVRDHVGVDCIINAVPTITRGIAGLFVGDLVQAHRAGVEQGRQVFATTLPPEPVDVVITNTYPKDSDFLQNAMGLNILYSAPRPVVREGGMIINIVSSPEGRGSHGIFGPGMRYDPLAGQTGVPDAQPELNGIPLYYFSPWLTPADVRSRALFTRWDDAVAVIQTRYGDHARVAVFPCGAIQLATA